jgi:hypothetical protein
MKNHRYHHDSPASLNRVAWMATLHCLGGCAIGEVAGMAIGTALSWSDAETIALAVTLAFVTGYLLTMLPLLRGGYDFDSAMRVAFAADTASVAIMEFADNLALLMIPGAMDAQVTSIMFWSSLAASLGIAAAAAFPLNRWLISKGQGHALAHAHHCGG